MRKLLTVIFSLISVFAFADMTDTTYFCGVDGAAPGGGGDGTKANPYNIATFESVADTLSGGWILALSDTVYYFGEIDWADVDGASGDTIKVIMWNKYGNGKVNINGTKQLTSWTSAGGGLYTKTDADLPNSRKFDVYVGPANNYQHVNLLNNIFVNGVWRSPSMTPDDGSHYDMESASNDGWFTDSDLSLTTNEKVGAYVYAAVTMWNPAKALITSNSATSVTILHSDFPQEGPTSIPPYKGYPISSGYNNNGSGEKYKFVNDVPDKEFEYSFNYAGPTITLYSPTTNPTALTIRAPIYDYLMFLDDCSYIKFEGISFWSGNIFQVNIHTSNNIFFTDCDFYYSGFAAVNAGYSYDIFFLNDTVMYANDYGFHLYQGTGDGDHSIIGCYFKNIGTNEWYADNKHSGYVAIKDHFGDNTYAGGANDLYVAYNIADSLSGAFIVIVPTGDEAETLTYDPNINVYRNLIKDYCLHINDMGGIYCINYNGNERKYIRGNILYRGGGIDNDNFSLYPYPFKYGIYTDNYQSSWTVDSNTVYDQFQFSLYNSIENDHMYWHDNTVVDNNIYDWNTNYQSGFYRAGDNDALPNYFRFTRNLIVPNAETGSTAFTWYHDGTPSYTGMVVDSNYYYDLFRGDGRIFGLREDGVGAYDEKQFMTQAEWVADQGWDAVTTVNAAGWEFADVSGIDEEDFVWLFANASSTAHEFDLGDCSFVDTAGTSVSGNLSVDPYMSRVLFYVSGTLSTVADPLYYSGYTGGGGGGAPPAGVHASLGAGHKLLLNGIYRRILIGADSTYVGGSPSGGGGGGGGGVTYTDDFDAYTPATSLEGQGYWLSALRSAQVYDAGGGNYIRGNVSTNEDWCVYYNRTLEDDQSSEVIIRDAADQYREIGVAVRATANNYYAYIGSSTTSYLLKVVSGSRTNLGVGDGFTADDVIKLVVNGTTLSCYKNGVLDTSIDGDGEFTDASIASGYAGIAGNDDANGHVVDDWEGSDDL